MECLEKSRNFSENSPTSGMLGKIISIKLSGKLQEISVMNFSPEQYSCKMESLN